jgi:uncharacterized protein involved in type VI secretion and phage assembly
MVKLQTNGKDAKSVIYSGLSYLPLGIGQKFTIENKTVEHKLVVIEVTHNSEVHGNYSCNFKAIPSDVGAPHYTNVHAYAKSKSQSAKVIDNNDPEGMGRVKVEFNWGGGNMKSDWMRKLQSYAGEGRGMYWTPEIGDEVVVDFVGGSAERPYVVGSHYNGKEKSGYATAGNDFKVIKNRSGQYLEFEELKNITLADKKGNKIHIDSDGSNLNLIALETINVKCKNFKIEVSENMETNVGQSATTKTGKDMSFVAETDIFINATGNYSSNANERFEMATEEYSREAKEIDQYAEQITMSSTKDNIILNASKEVKLNSGEKSNLF